MHAVLRELVAGGAPRRLSADRAAKVLRSVRLDGLNALERKRLAADLLADMRRSKRPAGPGNGTGSTRAGTAN